MYILSKNIKRKLEFGKDQLEWAHDSECALKKYDIKILVSLCERCCDIEKDSWGSLVLLLSCVVILDDAGSI